LLDVYERGFVDQIFPYKKEDFWLFKGEEFPLVIKDHELQKAGLYE